VTCIGIATISCGSWRGRTGGTDFSRCCVLSIIGWCWRGLCLRHCWRWSGWALGLLERRFKVAGSIETVFCQSGCGLALHFAAFVFAAATRSSCDWGEEFTEQVGWVSCWHKRLKQKRT